MALRRPRPDDEPAKQPRADPPPEEAAANPRRWLIPIGGGLLAAMLIVLSTPHVPWYLRVPLGLIALLYVAGQSAAYLWSNDQG